MATTANSRANSDAASVPFSYAQAAKGLVAAPGSSASKASSSGAVTPAKDSQSTSTSAAAVMSWAEDAEGTDTRPENTSASSESRTQNTKSAAAPNELTAAALASPEIGASTASTVTKDDDVSSIPNTSSDSTWENKSQASTSVDKSTEPSEKSSQKGKGKKREQAPAKPLQEAPLPAVNIWQQRAELRKPAKPATAAATSSSTANGASAPKQSKDIEHRPASNEVKTRGAEEERANSVRQETKTEPDSDKVRKNTRARHQERDARETPGAFSLPPERDQESWPTMDAATAINEDRKKALEKTEKSDKERKESTGAKSKGQWVKVPFVPSVNFNTPLPSTGARRGGRGPARGGAQNGGRAGASTSGPEKDTSSPATTANGDLSKRGRPDVPVRETSPKAKRTASASSLAIREKSVQLNGEKPKSTPTEIDSVSKENGVLSDSQNNISGPNQHNSFPRQYPSNRPSKGKRTEWSGPDRRKEVDSSAPLKENGINDRTSASTQTDSPEDAERRTFPEGQVPYQSKRGAGDRYGSYNSRERRGGRGGGRGGNFSNGHQFANGHMKSSSTYPGPMSPTAFNPEQSPYFPQSRYRNGPRSQSVTNENMYRMPGQFGAQQMPPINTYMGGNGYDYPMMQPMSAAPFGQFGMDHFAMFSMVTTQLEYYFSLENLCKDMYLRKHMDSKGFVFLSFISDFNRIKHLTTDLELIKLVCYQSRAIEFRVGHDGKDRLRARENWQQWILPVEERDPSAQNEGPEELYNPPIPHPNGFDPNGNPRYPDMSVPSSSGPGTYGTEGPHPMANGFHPGAPQHVSATPSENVHIGVNAEHVNGDTIPNGHPIDDIAKA